MPRILLLLPTSTYRAPDFVRAAARLGVDVVVGSEEAQALAAGMGDRAVVVPLDDPEVAADAIVALDRRAAIDAVVAVDDRGVLAAATAGERLGFPHNPPAAVAATRDKASMRTALARAEVPQPRFVVDSDRPTSRYPWVMKPVDRSGSQGVIRVDDADAARAAVARIGAIAAGPVLVEEYVPGSRSRSRASCARASSSCSPCSTSPIRWWDRTSRRPSTSRRRASTRRRSRAWKTWRRVPAPRSVWSKGRCTPSCGSTATACG